MQYFDFIIYIIKHKSLDIKKCFEYLSCNSNITCDDIVDTLHDYPWSFFHMSKNYNITPDFVRQHIHENWDYKALSSHPNIRLGFIIETIHKPWDWNILSSRFTPGEIESHIESLPWNTYKFNYMNGLTFDFIEKYSNVNWDFNAMSRLLSFNLELATQRPELDWNWRSMSFNDNLTVEFAKKYLLQNGIWMHISSNSRITCHDISSNPDLPWDWDGISSNSNLTLPFIEQNKERLCFQKVSGCANLTCDFISRHFSRNWNWKRISRTIYISTHILQLYSHFPWNYAEMSYNSNLTVDILYNFKDKEWDWFRVLKNEMQCTLHICAETKYYLERQEKTHEKQNTISEELLLAAFKPNRFYNWCLSIDQQKMIK